MEWRRADRGHFPYGALAAKPHWSQFRDFPKIGSSTAQDLPIVRISPPSIPTHFLSCATQVAVSTRRSHGPPLDPVSSDGLGAERCLVGIADGRGRRPGTANDDSTAGHGASGS